jgi:hypothetical protein
MAGILPFTYAKWARDFTICGTRASFSKPYSALVFSTGLPGDELAAPLTPLVLQEVLAFAEPSLLRKP